MNRDGNNYILNELLLQQHGTKTFKHIVCCRPAVPNEFDFDDDDSPNKAVLTPRRTPGILFLQFFLNRF